MKPSKNILKEIENKKRLLQEAIDLWNVVNFATKERAMLAANYLAWMYNDYEINDGSTAAEYDQIYLLLKKKVDEIR